MAIATWWVYCDRRWVPEESRVAAKIGEANEWPMSTVKTTGHTLRGKPGREVPSLR